MALFKKNQKSLDAKSLGLETLKKQKAVVDTNYLMIPSHTSLLKDFLDDGNQLIVSIITVQELDRNNHKDDDNKKFKARNGLRFLRENKKSIMFDLDTSYDEKLKDTEDNKIITTALRNKAKLLTLDMTMQLIAEQVGVECIELDDSNKKENIYLGYKEVVMNDLEMANFYQCMVNKWELLDNEYLLVKNSSGEIVDKFKYTDKGFVRIVIKSLKSVYLGDIRAKDEYQSLAIDSLYNDQFTILFGKSGSAKTLLGLAYIMQQIQMGKVSKAVIVFNSTELKGTKSLGYYPGSRIEKLLSGGLGSILSTKFGDISEVEKLVDTGKLLLLPMCEIRGMEVGEDEICFITEAQNADTYALKTLIQRCKGKIIVEGDLFEQTDIRSFGFQDSGMYRAIEVFKGHKEFSCVKLKNRYRSPVGDIADLM